MVWPLTPLSLCLRCCCIEEPAWHFFRNKAWQNTPNEASALEVTRDRVKYRAVTDKEKGNTRLRECADSTRDLLIVWMWNKRHMSGRKSVRTQAKGHCGCVQSERRGFCYPSCTSLACQYSEVDPRWMWSGPLNRSALSLFLSRVLLHGDLLLNQMLHTDMFKKSINKCLRWISHLLNLLNLDKSQPVTVCVAKKYINTSDPKVRNILGRINVILRLNPPHLQTVFQVPYVGPFVQIMCILSLNKSIILVQTFSLSCRC